MPKLTSHIWMDSQALEAAEFYVSIFPNSEITNVLRHTDTSGGEPGAAWTVDFELDGTPYTTLNGGPHFTLDEAFSIMVHCQDQAEVDHYWDRLVDGGEPSACGWLKDRFGLSWQIVPDELYALISDADPARADRATQAMLATRGKLDVETLRAAADGATVS